MAEEKKNDSENHYDLIVIGGGSGGIACARRAAAYKKKVLLFEKNKLGGTCVNVGCVPKKIMWQTSSIATTITHHAKHYGFDVDLNKFDYPALKKKRDAYIKNLNNIYAKNLENNTLWEDDLTKNGVKYIMKTAKFIDTNTIECDGKQYTADTFMIAVGGKPLIPDIPGKEFIWTSDDFFNTMEELPKKVGVIGAGYIAVELSQVLKGLGSEVDLFIRYEHPLRHFDSLVYQGVHEALLKSGVNVVNNTTITEILKNKDNNLLTFKTKEGKTHNGYDRIIYAVGRGPDADELKLDNVKIKVDDRGFIITDEYEQTNIKNIYAIGDINNKNALTPVAIRAGRKWADRMYNDEKDAKMDYENVPTVIFSHPPIGTIGLSEEEVRKRINEKKLPSPIRIYESHFRGLYWSMMSEESKEYTHMKIICVGANEKVVGLHIIGEGADEMLQGFGVAIKMGATKSDFDNVTAIHPTSAEELVTIKKPIDKQWNYKIPQ